MSLEIAALILAAGKGSRIGKPKWQLTFNGQTFLEIIYTCLEKAGISQKICMVRDCSIPSNKEFMYVINPSPEYGMFSSVYFGVRSVKDIAGFMIMPVDQPFTCSETLKKICNIFTVNKCKKIVRPCFNNKPGHPIIIPTELLNGINSPDYEGGLKNLIRSVDIDIVDVSVDDKYIHYNINTRKNLVDSGLKIK